MKLIEFFKPNRWKILIFLVIVMLASFIEERLNLGDNTFFLEPVQFARGALILGMFLEKYSVYWFGVGSLQTYMLLFISGLTILLYFGLSCYVYHKKNFFKDYKFIALLVFFLIALFANTIDKNSYSTDVPAVYGFPFTFLQIGCGWCIEPCLNCHPGFRPLPFLVDVVLWSAIYLFALLLIRKLRGLN